MESRRDLLFAVQEAEFLVMHISLTIVAADPLHTALECLDNPSPAVSTPLPPYSLPPPWPVDPVLPTLVK